MSASATASPSRESVSPAVWRYGVPAILLHWLLAALIAFMAGFGWYMMTIEKTPSGPPYFHFHQSVGLLVAGLVVLRVLWRVFHKPASLPAALPPWQVELSSVTHWLLYACMVVMPVTGIAGSAYSRDGIWFFGLHLPLWSTPSRAISHLFFSIHSAAVWILVALVVVHTAAGLKHLVAGRDAVFQRMWF